MEEGNAFNMAFLRTTLSSTIDLIAKAFSQGRNSTGNN